MNKLAGAFLFGILFLFVGFPKLEAQIPTLKMSKATFALSVTGYYKCNDGGYYYLRQDGKTVYWFGESSKGSWANVFKGTINGNVIKGKWYDVPKGKSKGKGTLSLKVSNDKKTISRTAVTGGFGGSSWTRGTLPASLPGKKSAGYSYAGNSNNLAGSWKCDKNGTYYIRQIGSAIFWFGEQNFKTGKPGWANVAFGTKIGNDIQLNWVDVPKCKMSGKGSLKLRLKNSNELVKVSGANFGSGKWTRTSSASETWVNKDTKTKGVTKVTFTNNMKTINVWGKCAPKDCDWGKTTVKPTTYQGYNYYAAYTKSFVTRKMYFKKSGSSMQVKVSNQYKDSRGTKVDNYTFKKPSTATVKVTSGKLDKSLMTTAVVKSKNPRFSTTYGQKIKLNPNTLVLNPSFTTPSSSEEEEEDIGTTVQGPNLLVSKDINVIFGDPSFTYFSDKLNLFRELYEDKNPKSGYFYYLPANYNLKWSKETGEFSFYIYYLSADDEGRGDVIVTAELSPSISRTDIELAEILLTKKLNKDIKLVPIPLTASPEVSFGNSLSNFDVDESTISTNVPTDFLQSIVVSWKMDQRVDDLVGAMMHNIGISGSIEFSPYAVEGGKKISVPVKLKVNDPGTYGKMEYSDAPSLLNGFYNAMDYPVVLSDLIILRESGSKALFIDKVPITNYEVEPQKFSSFSQSEISQVQSGGLIKKMWLNYSIKSCDTCNTVVQNKILGGTSSSRVNEIEIEVLTPLESSEANSLKVLIKSLQGDPKGKTEVMLPIVNITEDGKTYSGGELFIDEGEEPAFEYQIFLIQSDGEVVSSDWVSNSELFVIIGENTISNLFSESDE